MRVGFAICGCSVFIVSFCLRCTYSMLLKSFAKKKQFLFCSLRITCEFLNSPLARNTLSTPRSRAQAWLEWKRELRRKKGWVPSLDWSGTVKPNQNRLKRANPSIIAAQLNSAVIGDFDELPCCVPLCPSPYTHCFRKQRQ